MRGVVRVGAGLAMLASLVGAACSGSDSGSGPADARPAEPLLVGEQVYQQSCAACHGGSGQGGSGPPMVGIADRLTRDQHLEIVRNGRGSMPPWEDRLSDEEIDAVVDYERTVLSAADSG